MKDDKGLISKIRNRTFTEEPRHMIEEIDAEFIIKEVRQHDRERLQEALNDLFNSDAPIISEKALYKTIDKVYK